MKIIIVGDGKVGYTLSDHLSREGHDITVIDNKSEALRKSIDSLDVYTIKGNGASFAVLNEAGVSETDLLIAATSTDEVNMLCCLFAKRLGAKHTIARMRDPDYNEQLETMKDEMGLSMIINPEQATASEILRLITFPSAISVGTFANGRVSVIEYRLHPDSNIAGMSIAKAMQKYYADILICAVGRDGKIYIPNGDFVLEEGDHIHIAGTHGNISDFLNKCGQHDKKIRSAMLVGGGLIAFYLSKMLIESGYSVKIIEMKPEKCGDLCEKIPQALIIEGDGTDQEILDSERVDHAGAFVALTDMDEENLIMSMYASHRGVPKVIAKINRTGYTDVIKKAGIDSVISPKNITANHIVRFVRRMSNINGSYLKTLYMIEDQAEVMEFQATSSTRNLGVTLAEMQLKKNVLITAIVRGGKLIIPKGRNKILEGDTVIVITTIKQLEDLNEIFAAK
ncbi:Trk system potassium transporter TrkA [Candidatus Nomurabacteria bacterium]|nr:Trk system potassium transporter TrkA [Candidatus Nomurabacteria bacterium]